MKLILMILFACFFMGCSDTKNLTSQNVVSFTDTYWQVAQLNNINIITLSEKKPFVIFHADKRVSGHAGCNGFGGEYIIINESELQVGSLIGTQMACDDLENENNLKRVLENTRKFAIRSDSLILSDSLQQPIAVFIALDQRNQ